VRHSLLLLILLVPSFARAQSDPQRVATAQALFTRATELMKAGDFAAACPKLEEAVRLEPSAAGGKLKLAECYEGAGRLASAWGAYGVAEVAARAAGQPDRERTAQLKAAELKPRLSTISVRVRGEPARVVVERDGMAVGAAQLGTPVPVDGGKHTIAAHAEGKRYWDRTVEIAVEKQALEIDVPLPPPPPAADPPPPPPAAPAPRPVEPPRAVPGWSWAVGAVGLAAIGVGIALRVDAANVEAEQAKACGAALDQCPSTFDVPGTNQHKQDSFAAAVGLGVLGGAATSAAIIGAAVSLSASRHPRASVLPLVEVGPGRAWAGARVAW